MDHIRAARAFAGYWVRAWAFPVTCALIAAGVAATSTYYGYTEYNSVFGAANVGLSAAFLVRQHDQSPDRMAKRSWSINCGLEEGYTGKGKLHPFETARDGYLAWLDRKHRTKTPHLTGSITPDLLCYPIDRAENGTLIQRGAVAEPSACLRGELRPRYDQHRTDEEVRSLARLHLPMTVTDVRQVLETLRDLALHMLHVLGQHRVYYSYVGTQYSVDRDPGLAAAVAVVAGDE